MNKETYEIYQAIAHLLVNREYKPNEFGLFQAASSYLGAQMREYENGLEENTEVGANSGSDVPDSAPVAKEG